MEKKKHIWVLILFFLISGCINQETNLSDTTKPIEINKDNYLNVAKNILKTSNISFMKNYQDRNCKIINGSEIMDDVFELWVICESGPHDCYFFLYNNSTVENMGCAVTPEYPNIEAVTVDD